MKAFVQIVWLELIAFIRSRAFLLLVSATLVWMFVLPYLMTTDGTADGAHQIYIRYALGGVFGLLAVCLAASAAGSLAKDRQAKRLQLTLVRPVRYWWVALGRTVALTFVGAVVLTIAAGCALVRTNPLRPCYHVLSPILESPRAEAERMYEVFMADPETPPEVRRTRKSVVLRLLTQKALDHYQTIGTNETAQWEFPAVPVDRATTLAVRLRFTNMFEMRDQVKGLFTLGENTAMVSNLTRSIVTVPFEHWQAPLAQSLVFLNEGENSLMLRPRRDIHLLYGSTSSFFAWNLVLAVVELIAILAVVIAFALFLSASLGRSVAIFTVLVCLFLSAVSPAVIEQYPDQLETNRKDSIGLALTRFVQKVSSPIAAFNPITALSEDEVIEVREVGQSVWLDLIGLPLVLAFLSGLVMPRKQEDV